MSLRFPPEMEAVFLKARSLAGDEAQLALAQEECGELVAAVSQFRRGRIVKESLIEEVGDVLLTAVHAAMILGVEDVNLSMAKKVSRLKVMLEFNQSSIESTQD